MAKAELNFGELGGVNIESISFGENIGYRDDASFSATVGKYYVLIAYYGGTDVATVTGADIISYSGVINDSLIGSTYGKVRFYLIKATSATVKVNSRCVDYAEFNV
jgi:hypothetical protein